MEKWFVAMKKADFNGIAEKYQISPIIARLMRNRDVIGDEAIDFYLNGTVEDLYDGLLMKDMDRAVDILKEKIEEGKKDLNKDKELCAKAFKNAQFYTDFSGLEFIHFED